MILGLDVSTSITGATVLNLKEEILYCEAWKLQNKKHFPDLFSKAEAVKGPPVEYTDVLAKGTFDTIVIVCEEVGKLLEVNRTLPVPSVFIFEVSELEFSTL